MTGVATDTHRLSSSSIPIQDTKSLKPFILPKKTVFQLSNLLQENNQSISMFVGEGKIQFKMGNSSIVSKVIDGKFPDYEKVVPKNNNKILKVNAKDFINSLETSKSLFIKSIVKPNLRFTGNACTSIIGTRPIFIKFNKDVGHASAHEKSTA